MESGVVGGRVATSTTPLRCAVFISGSGSGMEAMVLAQRRFDLPHETTVVVSNHASIEGLKRAEKLGIPTVVVERTSGERTLTREEHEAAVMEQLAPYDVEFIVLSGYMRLLSPVFLTQWEHRVVNIHPSLLPNFPGAHAHRDVLAAHARLSGCTVHLVDEGMDTGAILAQSPVPVFSEDDEASLSQRVKIEEHRLYPRVLTWIAEGRVHFTADGLKVEGVEGRLVD